MKLEGNRKVLITIVCFFGVIYTQKSGVVIDDNTTRLLQTLFGLFYGGNLAGDHGKEIVKTITEYLATRPRVSK